MVQVTKTALGSDLTEAGQLLIRCSYYSFGQMVNVDFLDMLCYLQGHIHLKVRGLILIVEHEGREFPVLFFGAFTLENTWLSVFFPVFEMYINPFEG